MDKRLQHIDSVYFIGIGGIGMSALARWFKHEGRLVAGYDKTSTPLTQALEQEGITVHYTDDVALIPEEIKAKKDSSLVIFTPAIPASHSEKKYLEAEGFQLVKRSEVLGMITAAHFNVGVAGTHGKTTTSSMLSWLLHGCEKPCTAFVGGIVNNFNSNLLLSKAPVEETIAVAEADEYDRSFLRLSPDMAIITAVDADHLDIYGDANNMSAGFEEFAGKIRKNGKLFLQADIELSTPALAQNQVQTISFGIDQGDYKAENIRAEGISFIFDLVYPKGKIEDLTLNMPGFHNVENATAAMAVCLELGIAPELVKTALGKYRGVKRRFDILLYSEKAVYIDDYAHHPTEITAFIKSVKALFPNKKLTVVFQPHLFSRTRDFAEGFSESLSLADSVILLPIYPARELPIEGITSEMLLENISIEDKKLVEDEDLLSEIENRKPELLATIGAGDIDRFPIKIADYLSTYKV
ncbi:UDP-N-acetylmuramate--L-alanine ligase [Flammeovirgaceae bacterium SG7u.132]|nr:UDP-N-acetylmuramate--L-alanine ligase [Flammeovirgaceae bacterium SG7u.132]